MTAGPRDLALITGATGFIGGRIVELLAARGVRLRAVTSDFRHCSRIARFPLQLVKADLRDPVSFALSAAGCTAVVHAAHRFDGDKAEQTSVNVSGTRALAEAALTAGVRNFVHLSSVAVYGPPGDRDISEGSPVVRCPDAYTSAKQAVEETLTELHRTRGLPLTILQPTIVYGPFGGAWTTRLIAQIKNHRFILPCRGEGVCNAVYVDDVAAAVMLALSVPAPRGQRYLVSGPAPVTWREFYGAYEQMMDRSTVAPVDDAGYREEERQLRLAHSWSRQMRSFLGRRPALRNRFLDLPPQRWLLRCARAVLPASLQSTIARRYAQLWQLPPEPPLPALLPDPGNHALFSARQRVQIDRIRNELGYAPAYDLAAGMKLTAAWARWAHLLET